MTIEFDQTMNETKGRFSGFRIEYRYFYNTPPAQLTRESSNSILQVVDSSSCKGSKVLCDIGDVWSILFEVTNCGLHANHGLLVW